MKRIILILTVMAAFVLTVSGCGKQDLGDVYHEGSDYQYKYSNLASGDMIVQKGKSGYFFVSGQYIYYMDSQTKQVKPLCSKADCLHDRETDREKRASCNALLSETDNYFKIAYCDGYLYSLNQNSFEYDESSGKCYQCLVRMKEDGSKRENIYRWDADEVLVSDFCIHRGVMYYTEESLTIDRDSTGENGVNHHYTVKKMDLSKTRKTPETIYTPDKNIDLNTISHYMAYGNHVFFQMFGATTKDADIITEENFGDYLYMHIMNYDIKTGEFTDVTFPGMTQSYYASSITFWKDKLLVEGMQYGEKMDYKTNVYIENLDGSSPELFMEDIPQGEMILSDGKYLYLDNETLIRYKMEKEQVVKVYDENKELIDTICSPYPAHTNFFPGAEDVTYYIFYKDKHGNENIGCEPAFYDDDTDSDGAVLEIKEWDKSKIGTYQGKNQPIFETVAEFEFSALDQEIFEGNGQYLGK